MVPPIIRTFALVFGKAVGHGRGGTAPADGLQRNADVLRPCRQVVVGRVK